MNLKSENNFIMLPNLITFFYQIASDISGNALIHLVRVLNVSVSAQNIYTSTQNVYTSAQNHIVRAQTLWVVRQNTS